MYMKPTSVLSHSFLVMLLVLGAAFLGVGTPVSTTTPSVPQATNPTPTTPTTSTPTPTKTTTKPATMPAKTGYTPAQVMQHNSAQSCWSAINGNVYDLTDWINQHPGGPEAILSLCGTDGSAAFNDQHGGQRRPANELAGFLIGPLVQ